MLEGPSTFTSLQYSKAVNSVGALGLSLLDTDDSNWAATFVEDMRIQVWRTPGEGYRPYLDLDAVWFVTKNVTTIGQDRKRTLEIGAKSALDLAARRIVAYSSGSAQATVAGAAETMIKRIISENLGASAGGGRTLSISVPTSAGLGASTNKQVGWRNALQSIQEIARDSEAQGTPLYFDIVAAGSTALQFQVWVGQPGTVRTSPLLSLESGTLRSASWGFDRDGTQNVVYGLGQEFGGARQVAAVFVPAATATPFSRREVTLDARNAVLTSELTAEARSELLRNQPKDVIVAELANVQGALYGVHWKYGDRVSVLVGGKRYAGMVDSIQVSVSGSREQVQARLKF